MERAAVPAQGSRILSLASAALPGRVALVDVLPHVQPDHHLSHIPCLYGTMQAQGHLELYGTLLPCVVGTVLPMKM